MMAEVKRLSFVENMWEGMELIKEKTETGLKSCKDVLDFFKRLAALEEEYSKNLAALVQRYPTTNSNLTLSQGWKGVMTVLDGQAATHKNVSVNFMTNLCHPLQALLKDMENRRKQLVSESVKHKTELRDHTELVKKAKAKYEKCSKDLETARNELTAAKSAQDPQPAKISKFEQNVASKEAEANLSETQYKLQVQTSNNFLDAYQSERWPYVLNEFEQFEITRISFMKANIHNFMGLLKEMPSVLEAEVSTGLKASEQIDPEVDIQLFIDANKSPKELLSPFAFEPYAVLSPTARPASVSRPLSRIWDNFGLGLSSSKEEVKVPTIFGVSLNELMDKQKDEPSLLIPKLLAVLSEAIISQNGLNTEGIFRLAGSTAEVQALRRQFDKGDYTINTNDVHVLATLLKQFFRDLPEAVIPTSYYDDCVNNRITPGELLAKLPPINKTVLLYILNFLQIFIKPNHLKTNKMNSANLSTIFATVLLRSPQKDPSAVLAGLTNEFQFIERLILTAPPVDANQFPIFAMLQQTTKALPALPASPPTTTTTAAFSPPTSPLTTSSNLGEVAYSTATSSSVTSFEDMSSKDDQVSDFSETDHFEEDRGAGKDDSSEKDNSQGKTTPLGSSEELPEFVIVPSSKSD